LALKDTFRAQAVDVFMTRDDATDHAPVGRRAAMAKNAGCDVLISLHLNDLDMTAPMGSKCCSGTRTTRRWRRSCRMGW
jgi:N-acetylmuramoyl-L-alanine amidase